MFYTVTFLIIVRCSIISVVDIIIGILFLLEVYMDVVGHQVAIVTFVVIDARHGV